MQLLSGARGGFHSGRPAREISLRAVREGVVGRLSLITFIERRAGFCRLATVCTQFDICGGAQQMVGTYWEGISIGDIADGRGLVPRRRGGSPSGWGQVLKVN
jgi:DNA-binding IscR family transcriptional regulator